LCASKVIWFGLCDTNRIYVFATFRQNFKHPGWYFSMKLSREIFVKNLQTFVPKFSGNFRVKFRRKFCCRNTTYNMWCWFDEYKGGIWLVDVMLIWWIERRYLIGWWLDIVQYDTSPGVFTGQQWAVCSSHVGSNWLWPESYLQVTYFVVFILRPINK